MTSTVQHPDRLSSSARVIDAKVGFVTTKLNGSQSPMAARICHLRGRGTPVDDPRGDEYSSLADDDPSRLCE